LKEIELAPDPHLLESMRAVGYSFETAVADLLDNSIAAGASKIDVLASPNGTLRLSILDDGSGMDRATAMSAMRLAARSPNEVRSAKDLGRFGLGLKTASLSQCRRLTLATRRDGVTTVLRWDLDHVVASGTWSVLELEPAEVHDLWGWERFNDGTHGTLVSWEDLDLLAMTEGSSQSDFDAALVRVRSHCELVFHRFATGDGCAKVQIHFNGNPVEMLDPFVTSSKATQCRDETIRVDGVSLPVRAYTLPFINKMTSQQKQKAMVAGSLRDSQGFYIYRGGRLVIWGTWFRLNPKSEMAKLARVRVDVPNSLDHLWALDIKKSQATPPREMRDALRILAGQLVAPSERVQRFRGRKLKADDSLTRVWDVVVERDKDFRYEVNRHHPLLRRFCDALEPEQLTQFAVLLDVIEQSFPVADAHNRLSDDGVSVQDRAQLDELVSRALSLRPVFLDTHPGVDDFVSMLLSMEPYGSSHDFESTLRKVLGRNE
jgi:hypothetical protein